MAWEEQKKEIDTIKERTFQIRLSDADVKRIFEQAGKVNLSPEELLENFIGDLVDGTYSNGSAGSIKKDGQPPSGFFSRERMGPVKCKELKGA